MTINLDMFGAFMKHWVMCNVNNDLIIIEKQSWRVGRYPKVMKKLLEPRNLTSCNCECTIFSFYMKNKKQCVAFWISMKLKNH